MAEWLVGCGHYVNDLRLHAVAKSLGSGLFVACSSLFGLPHAPSEALLKLMVFDFALGAAHAWQAGNRLDFAKFLRGVRKILLYGIAVNVGIQMDVGTGVSFLGASWQGMICGYLCTHEALSALTHMEAFGFPFPKEIKVRLRQYRDSIGRTQVKAERKNEEDIHGN